MGDEGGDATSTSPPPLPTPASKTARKRQTGGERATNLLRNTAEVRPGNIDVRMASAEYMREQQLKQANAAVAQLLTDMVGAGPRLLPCTTCKVGVCKVDTTPFAHTVVARDFCRKDVQLPRHIRCTGCGAKHHLDPLYFGFFSANPVKKVCKPIYYPFQLQHPVR